MATPTIPASTMSGCLCRMASSSVGATWLPFTLIRSYSNCQSKSYISRNYNEIPFCDPRYTIVLSHQHILHRQLRTTHQLHEHREWLLHSGSNQHCGLGRGSRYLRWYLDRQFGLDHLCWSLCPHSLRGVLPRIGMLRERLYRGR